MTAPPPGSQLAEAEYWSVKVEEAKRGGQLDLVQKAATAWSALFSALLGVFGVVAFSGGLQEVDDLGSPWAFWAKVLTVVAAGALGLATFFAARASGRLFPTTNNDTSWSAYRNASSALAKEANENLKSARKCGLLAVLAVAGGSMLALWAPAAKASAPSVVVDVAGVARCGRLVNAANESLLVEVAKPQTPESGMGNEPTSTAAPPEGSTVTSDGNIRYPVSSAATLVVVDSCPEH